MINMAIKALEFGVLGLCAITLLLVYRILQTEQKREGYPRQGILQASYVFMAFAVALALLIAYVQLSEHRVSQKETALLQAKLRVAEDKLLQIRSAASPILTARSNIISDLPPGPARNTLATLVQSLKTTLE